MKNKISIITGIVIGILVLSLFLAGCTNLSDEQDDGTIDVIVSILPQKAFVEEVAGDLVNVKELIPPGASPATYEPEPSTLALVEKADIYFRIGYIPFEKSHIDTLTDLNSDMTVVDTSVDVQLRYFDNGGTDPHIWLSPILVKKQVDTIAQTLSQEDPANVEIYNSNAEQFKNQLDALHLEIELQLSELKTDKLMIFHPAWGYFADEYGLEQIAIEKAGKEPTAQELEDIIELAIEEEIKVIFVQTQFDTNIAESVAEEVEAVVVSINPLSEDYINNLKNVATTISESLSGS
jgi:zinc transport system substrate-binding protein